MKFQKHTSDEMVELFSKKPFQGQDPEKARIIFLSSDANYSPKISNHAFFNYILEYQKDGIAFWKKYGCHHPFMLSNYPKEFNRNIDGVPFHRNFSKLGLSPEYAQHISFLELLAVPTIGNKSQDRSQFLKLISPAHLQYIENQIHGGGRKLFFISKGALKEMIKLRKTYHLFAWADFARGSEKQFTKIINANKIREIYHFSSTQIHSQLAEIKSEIDQWIEHI